MNIETDRLLLTPIAYNDVDTMYAMANDPFIRRYLFDDEAVPRSRIQSFIDQSVIKFEKKQYGLWLIRHKASAKQVGFAGLWQFFDEPQPQLLYALLPQHTKFGFAREASSRLIKYCFDVLDFTYLDAACDAINKDSSNVARAISMKKIKELEINGSCVEFYRVTNNEKRPT